MIRTVQPISPLLKKYIECFYVYEGKHNSAFKYLAFPHYNTGLSFFINASIQRKKWSISIEKNNQQQVHLEILGKYTTPVLLEYSGAIREVSIVFKPLGLNRFINETYNSIAPQFSQEFKNQSWIDLGQQLFLEKNCFNKLESFLITQFSEKEDLRAIEKSLEFLENTDDSSSIFEIASKLGLNLKTFQRHFKKHMGCSPIEYRRIYRFRHTLNSKLNYTKLKKLTEVTYEGGYFDQSYFIKEFRKLTSHSPKDFFKVAIKVDGDKLIWEIK